MPGNSLKLTSFDPSRKTIELDGDNDSQSAFFRACCSRKLNFSVLFLCMKMTILVPSVALAASWQMPRADAFSIPVANAEEGLALHSQLYEVIQSLNLPNASYGVLPPVSTTLPLCTTTAVQAPTSAAVNTATVVQGNWEDRTTAEQDKTLGR